MSSDRVAPWLVESRWPTVPIRLVARLGSGHTPSRSKPEYWENCTKPWITLADVWQIRSGQTTVITATKEKISPLGLANSSATLRPAGTVILSRTASVGFSAIMGHEMATSQDFVTWTCGPRLDSRYLLHTLRGMAPDLKRVATGSTHKTIYMPDIEQLRVPLPPVEEQRRIADFLDAETARIDQLVGRRNAQEVGLAERAYASVSEILLPGILSNPSGHWPWAWLPRAMDDRPLVRLGYVCRLQNGLTVDGKRDLSGDVLTRPYLRVANVQAGSVALDTVTEITVPRDIAARSTLRPGDVLMTEGGDLDKLGRGTVWQGELPECLHQNHVFALRPELDRLDGNYLALMTSTLHGRCYFESTGTKTTNLASTNSSKILSFPIPLPNVAAQRELAKQAQNALNAIEATSRLLKHQSAVLVERRQALITAAVTGQFDVSTASGRNVTDGVPAS
ncbi:restriction endonuclease subunit S [Streptomyces brevispora]|uniref:Restriction endonuclease subunit S n=1 Tax=Streptomyces brevispora TaxID=887462 RepID=A0A561V5Q0_9ACTN|nr:restriction endonuclease subunit S [Streptomyces brevispora]TWG06948.1 type I restriction enzyme S subunit [Streptomyces brevispora]WSC12195.1 restriction endonuclease subunit S [Streptomyces brevispora]